MKPGVHLVNVARGALVDQDALRAALDDGRVAMASLDAVEPEPLPAGHWMYTHPRVRLSPHVSWQHAGRGRAAASSASSTTCAATAPASRSPASSIARRGTEERAPRSSATWRPSWTSPSASSATSRRGCCSRTSACASGRWTCAPGERSATHRHELDYVLVQIEGDRIAAHAGAGHRRRLSASTSRPTSSRARRATSRAAASRRRSTSAQRRYREILIELK